MKKTERIKLQAEQESHIEREWLKGKLRSTELEIKETEDMVVRTLPTFPGYDKIAAPRIAEMKARRDDLKSRLIAIKGAK